MTKDEALKRAFDWYGSGNQDPDEFEKLILSIVAQPEGCQCPACKIAPHASDCPVHNEPAWPNGPCDCGAQPEKEPVDGYFLPMSALNEPMKIGIEKLIAHAKRARWTNAIVRKDSIETAYQADWIKSLVKQTTPLQRTWVGLTVEEREFLLHQALRFYDTNAQLLSFIKTVEAKLKEKNT